MLPLHNFTLQDFAKFGTILRCKIYINFQCMILQFYYNLSAGFCKVVQNFTLQGCPKLRKVSLLDLHNFILLEFAYIFSTSMHRICYILQTFQCKFCTSKICSICQVVQNFALWTHVDPMWTQCGHNVNTRRHSLTIKQKYTDKPSFAKSV